MMIRSRSGWASRRRRQGCSAMERDSRRGDMFGKYGLVEGIEVGRWGFRTTTR